MLKIEASGVSTKELEKIAEIEKKAPGEVLFEALQAHCRIKYVEYSDTLRTLSGSESRLYNEIVQTIKQKKIINRDELMGKIDKLAEIRACIAYYSKNAAPYISLMRDAWEPK